MNKQLCAGYPQLGIHLGALRNHIWKQFEICLIAFLLLGTAAHPADFFQVESFANASGGGSASSGVFSLNDIVGQPLTGEAHSVVYQVQAGFGPLIVVMEPWPGNIAAELYSGPAIEDGMFVVRYSGVPGLSYTIEYTDSVAHPKWQKLRTVTAPAQGAGLMPPGVFELRETANPGTKFFRVVYPAY